MKQTILSFGLNRNKSKRDLFRFCFGLFRETKKKFGLFWCFKTVSERTKTKNWRFETNRNGRLINFYATDTGVEVDMDMEVAMDMDMDNIHTWT